MARRRAGTRSCWRSAGASTRARCCMSRATTRAMARLAEALAFFAPERRVLRFPAWDCLPYDRVSPNPAIVSERIATLARLAASRPSGRASCSPRSTRWCSACRRAPSSQAPA